MKKMRGLVDPITLGFIISLGGAALGFSVTPDTDEGASPQDIAAQEAQIEIGALPEEIGESIPTVSASD